MSPGLAYGQVVSSSDLIENSGKFDGQVVIFRGEVVGDILRRGEYAWITVNDDAYSRHPVREGGKLVGGNQGFGIWVPVEETREIRYIGGYKRRGDIVEIVGIFNQSCPQHGGDMNIHALELSVIEPGRYFQQILNLRRALVALLLMALSLTMFWLSRWKRKRTPLS
jgi:hypothetical protein